MARNISILDATLRDGGQGLEDLYSNGFTNKYYTIENKQKLINLLSDSNVEIIELGAIGPSSDDKSKFAIYQNIEELSKYIPLNRKSATMYVGLYIGPDTNMDDIPNWNPSLVEGVRVIIRYSELQKSLDYCCALAKKGYKVFVQPMLTMRYTNKELDLIIDAANQMGAFACYFVDSYGYMCEYDVKYMFDYFDNSLNSDIKIGFHAHNNMTLAYSNALSFVNMNTNRDLIVDSCLIGMGQGAGNLQTELLVPYINRQFGKTYNYDSILDACDYLDKEMIYHNLWGYSVTHLLPSIYKTAYKYAYIMRYKYNMSFRDINKILRDMPDSMRNRYSIDSIIQLLHR